MEDISKLCMACLSIKDENNICPRCKKDVMVEQSSPLLPLKYILSGRYCIGKAMKKNGEGISYGAYDLELEKAVSVREFFPESIAAREADEIGVLPNAGSEAAFSECRTAFSELWKKLMRLHGLSSLITVTQVFEANGTVYAVYDESETVNLRDFLLSTAGGCISWEKARILFMPVLSTLGTLHTSGILHRGINPAAFIFSSDGRLRLTDFCTDAARSLLGDLEAEIFDGYAPLEQYSLKGEVGTWSDIYAFCAVLYRALIGTTPIDARTRAENDQMMIPAKFAEQLPPYVINAIINGMQIDAPDRTRNVEQLRSNLSASPRAVSASAPVYAEAPKPQPAPSQYAPKPQYTQPTPAQYTQPPQPQYVQPQDSYTEKVERYKAEVEKSEQKRRDRKKNALIAVLCVVLAALLCGIAFLAREIATMGKEEQTTQQELVAVPRFVGMEIKIIMENSVYTGNFNITQQARNDAGVKAGVVIEQSVAAGGEVARGTEINLIVSAGPKSTVIDDVTGMTYEQAAAVLSAKGFKCTKSTKYNDGTGTANTVIETIPPVGSSATEGSEVQIVVWQEPETTAPPVTFESENGGNSVQEFINGLLP